MEAGGDHERETQSAGARVASMSYLIIEDFRGGLDTRKFRLAAPAGTLTDLVNAHITSGAEIEKRKAFVKLINPNTLETDSLPSNTFGMQPVASGLLVFGSADLTGFSFPTGFSYQRLQHPAVLAGVAYDAAKHAMTEVIHSDLFGGAAFVIAKFADGYRFAYYGGTLVTDFVAGLVLPYLAGSNVRLAAHLTALANAASGFTAVQRPNPNDHQTDITGEYGTDYTSAETETAAAGTLTSALNASPTAPVSAISAVGSFRIVAGSAAAGTNKISKVEINGVTVTNGAVDWTTSNAATAAAIAASINAKSSSPEYTATSDGDRVIITASSTGTSPNAFEVKVTAAGNVCVGNCTLAFAFGTLGFTFNALLVDGADISGALAGKTVKSGGDYTTVSAFVSALATAIIGGGTYTAFAYGAVLYLSKAVTSSLDAPIDVYASVTATTGGTGAGVDGGPATPPAGTLAATAPATVAQATTNNPITSAPATCTVTGGLAPYTYRWQEEASGSGDSITINTPNAATTTFAKFISSGSERNGRFVCKVTDAAGVVVYSNAVVVHLEN